MVRPYLWYSLSTSVTGRTLAKEMGLTRMSPSSSDREYGTRIPPTGTTHVICWGAIAPNRWREYRKRNLRKRIVLNDPFLTEYYRNKLNALERMEEAGVSVPQIYKGLNFEINEDDFPIVGRTKYHYGGSGFKFIETREQLQGDSQSDYWLEYINGEDKREYRVHVFKDRVIKVSRKRPKIDDEGNEIEPISYRCRSHNNGWRFCLCDINRVHQTIINNATTAVQALNLDFGVVDVIRVPSTDTTVVLEVNTGVGLDNSGLELYSGVFSNFLGGA